MQIMFMKTTDVDGNVVLFNPASIVGLLQTEVWTGSDKTTSVRAFAVHLVGNCSFYINAKDESEALRALGMSTLQIRK